METITLIPEDDIVSICDRLDWAQDSRLLLLLPEDGRTLAEPVDLARLRRHADRLRLEVGMVTLDPDIRQAAGALGFPTFRSLEQAEKNERRWRRGRKRVERAGMQPEEVRKTFIDEADRRAVQRRRRPLPTWARWLKRYAAVIIFIGTLALLYLGGVYAIPGATITLHPYTETLSVSREIVADPQLDSVSFSGSSVPARVLTVVETWETEVATTGTLDIADSPARGNVVFVNTIEQPVNVPAGTRVSTSGGSRVVFQTLSAVDVPGAVGGTAEVDVVAVEAGPQGNVGANQINLIEGSLSIQLEVRNLTEVTGGGLRSVPAVTQADLDRLEAQVIQYLQTVALAQMEASLRENEFLARDSVRVTEILQQTVSHFEGEQSERVAMEIRAQIEATAVDTTQTTDLIYSELAGAVQPSFSLVPDSFRFFSGDVKGVDGDGRVIFDMIGEGTIAADLPIDSYMTDIAGQPTPVAMQYLYEQLPLARIPSARVIPNWFDQLPYLPVRIQTEVVTE